MKSVAASFLFWMFHCSALPLRQVEIHASGRGSEPVLDSVKDAPEIPMQIIMTGKEESIEALPAHLRSNVQKTLSLNPDMTLRYLGDDACRIYIRSHCDDELASIYEKEGGGHFRGDICRAAVLLHEGGFYADLDLQPAVPFKYLVDTSTKFMSVFTENGGVLNALMAAVPNSPIINNHMRELYKWYNEKGAQKAKKGEGEWMGPITLKRGFESFIKDNCPHVDLEKKRHTAGLQWDCGKHGVRFLREERLRHCGGRHLARKETKETQECPPERAKLKFKGARYGIFEEGRHRRLVAWPRAISCTGWWCGGR